jgi:hypothetical protein
MSNEKYSKFDSFEEFFAQAEGRERYWEERGKLAFLEEMLVRASELGIEDRAELNKRLKWKMTHLKKFLAGLGNFELRKMVEIARALDCELKISFEKKI